MAKDLASLGMTGGPSTTRAIPEDLFIVGLDGIGDTEDARIEWVKSIFPKIAGKLETFRDIRACVPVSEESVRVFRLSSAKPVAYESMSLTFPVDCGEWSGKRLICVNSGRQTVKIVRALNLKLAAKGQAPLTVVCAGARYATDLERVEAQTIENARLVRRTPMQRAWSAHRCIQAGSPREDVMVWAEVSTEQGLTNLLALLDCSPAVQQAVDAGPDSGGITQRVALEIAKKGDHDKQDEELQKRLGAAAGKKGRARSQAINGEDKKPKPVKPERAKQVTEILTSRDRAEMEDPHSIDGYIAIIRYFSGQGDIDALPDEVRDAVIEAGKKAASARAKKEHMPRAKRAKEAPVAAANEAAWGEAA